MQNIKNLTQLRKALKQGATFTFVNHWNKDYIGQHRVVNKAQTNGIYSIVPEEPDCKVSKANMGLGMWMDFEKAASWNFSDGICEFNRIKSMEFSFIVD